MINPEPKNAVLLKHIEVSAAGPNCQLRMGDLNGDGRLDFVLLQPDSVFDERYFPHSVAAATAYTADGEILWQIGKPSYNPVVCNTDLPAQIYDIDRDGNNELLCVMDGFFCVFDGKSGELKRRSPLPDKNAHDCFAIADLEGIGYPKNIIIKNRYHQLWAMDQNFNILWTYKGNIGHYPIICDLNNDGKDEIIAGSVVLDADGNLLWEFGTTDFPTSICVGDLNMSRQVSILTGGEKTQVYSPDGKVKWSLKTSAVTSNLTLGNIRPDSFGSEIAGFFTEKPESDYTDGLFLTDYHGNTLFKEKRTDYINCSDITTISNFDGNGYDLILVSARPGNKICVYDGYMNPIYVLPSEGQVYCGDILGDGVSQILIYNGQNLEIYSAEKRELTKPAIAHPRPQARYLYNYTKYPYTAADTYRYALGYAIGQFSKPNPHAWAQACAISENENVMSRADFCVILAAVLNISAYSTDVFFDVSKNDYFYPAVSTIKSYGYIDDIVGKFMPYAPVTAGFAVSIIQQAANFNPLTTKTDNDELTYRDVAKIILQIYQNMANSYST